MKLTRREEKARDELVDAATELAHMLRDADTEPGSYSIDGPLADAMNCLYLANDEWQEAQLAACGRGRRRSA